MAGGRGASRATISARGGTTGRAAGWPTKFGLAGGRNGVPPDPLPAPTFCEEGGAAPGVGLSAGRAGIGIVGTAALGRGAPGVVIITGGAGAEGAACAAGGGGFVVRLTPGALGPCVLTALDPCVLTCVLTTCVLAPGALAEGEVLAVSSGGSGWRGPERICPGRGGGGAERDGITGPRLAGAFGPPG